MKAATECPGSIRIPTSLPSQPELLGSFQKVQYGAGDDSPMAPLSLPVFLSCNVDVDRCGSCSQRTCHGRRDAFVLPAISIPHLLQRVRELRSSRALLRTGSPLTDQPYERRVQAAWLRGHGSHRAGRRLASAHRCPLPIAGGRGFGDCIHPRVRRAQGDSCTP